MTLSSPTGIQRQIFEQVVPSALRYFDFPDLNRGVSAPLGLDGECGQRLDHSVSGYRGDADAYGRPRPERSKPRALNSSFM